MAVGFIGFGGLRPLALDFDLFFGFLSLVGGVVGGFGLAGTDGPYEME